MCLAVYIAADQPLPPIDWNAARPGLYVTELSEWELPVRTQFTKPQVMYAGSHEGCGCGFQCGGCPDPLDADEAARSRASLDQLGAYLESEVERLGPIQLYVCWEGDQAAPVERRRTLSPTSLKSEDFFLLQGELLLVVTNQESSSSTIKPCESGHMGAFGGTIGGATYVVDE